MLILSCKKNNSISNETTVGIIPYKGMSSQEIDVLSKAITDYNIIVKVLPQQYLPKRAFITVKSPRYRADSLIAIQKRNMPENIDYSLGLTHNDI